MRKHRTRLLALSILASVPLAGSFAAAQADGAEPPRMASEPSAGNTSRWPIDDSAPESSLPSQDQRDRNPVEFGYFLMDLIAKGDRAEERGDHSAALGFYRALAKAVPDRSTPFVKMCAAQEAAGDRASAIESCARALEASGATVDDAARYVRLVLTRPEPPGAQETQALDAVLEHLRAAEASRLVAEELACEVGLRLASSERLRLCEQAVAGWAVDDPRTISWQWALALQAGDRTRAASLVRRAERAGMSAAGIERMTHTVEHWGRSAHVRGEWPAYLLAGLGASVLLGAWRWRSKRRESAASVAPPPSQVVRSKPISLT